MKLKTEIIIVYNTFQMFISCNIQILHYNLLLYIVKSEKALSS